MVRKNKKQSQICPLLDRECLKQDCEIHNETLDRCEIGLVNYNLYQLKGAIRDLVENQNLK